MSPWLWCRVPWSWIREFIHEYIRSRGYTDLECLVGYNTRPSNNKSLDIVTIGEMIKTVWAKAAEKYTEEEKLLQQRFVNSLTRGISAEELGQAKKEKQE